MHPICSFANGSPNFLVSRHTGSTVNMIRTDLTGECTFLIIIPFDSYMLTEIASEGFIIHVYIAIDLENYVSLSISKIR